MIRRQAHRDHHGTVGGDIRFYGAQPDVVAVLDLEGPVDEFGIVFQPGAYDIRRSPTDLLADKGDHSLLGGGQGALHGNIEQVLGMLESFHRSRVDTRFGQHPEFLDGTRERFIKTFIELVALHCEAGSTSGNQGQADQ